METVVNNKKISVSSVLSTMEWWKGDMQRNRNIYIGIVDGKKYLVIDDEHCYENGCWCNGSTIIKSMETGEFFYSGIYLPIDLLIEEFAYWDY